MSDSVVIVGIARTPMGGLQGDLSDVPATQLGSVAIESALKDAGISGSDVDQVYMGCVLPAGLGQAPARQASIGAGIPDSVTVTTMNKVCGSGMKTVQMACDTIQAGRAKIIVAGGMESMTRVPYLLAKGRQGYRLGHGEMLDHMYTDGLEDAYSGKLMGAYAENCAEKYSFSREEQDAYAIESLSRANKAIAEGKFKREVAPVTIKTRKGEVVVDTDEQPAKARPEKIPALKAVFKKDGTITPANASSISDGAAALVLMSESEAKSRGIKVLAKIKAQAEHAHQPEWFTTAPVGAIGNVLQQCQWSASDVDLYEVNEAFAVVTMAAMREYELDHAKVNVHGGACALGHPLGASGARIMVTLLAALETYDKKTGIAALCIGGGEGIAIAIERD
ncbi:thiolase family protein [Sessilibacter corallicola]|uniref:thiolase family protein n=1 Tax=Sessilibacter corallicola TaxID=2904075 RepID=UPI001E44B0FF|nr:thiolase family protein [Sessilibacter corallicola]MCE2027128.1 thiolase family protein [Sessilibacter corallicola]